MHTSPFGTSVSDGRGEGFPGREEAEEQGNGVSVHRWPWLPVCLDCA